MNIYERDYPNNRGKGGEVGVCSNYKGQYDGLNLAGTIEKSDEYFRQRITALERRNSSNNSVGMVYTRCRGTGLIEDNSLFDGWVKSCYKCDGTGRIYN